ncbi:MAG: HAD family phosphatase, partial [Chloroflexi bacterium]|nr:HAD family phosphatase [Chloroflexota bacterium]
FDFDGVLADSETWWHEVRQEVAAAHGAVLRAADHAACIGLNTAAWSAILARPLGMPAAQVRDEVLGGLVARYRDRPAPAIPGAISAARGLVAGRRAAIASGAHPTVLAAALASLAISDLVEVIVSADEVPSGKPAPDVYLEAARRLGVEPARAVAIEDSLAGVRAARAAGMRVVLVPNASVPPAPGSHEAADLVVAHLADLRLPPAGEGRR